MEDLQNAELEALSFVFTEDELRVVRRDPLEVAVQVAPYTGEDTRHQYVCASLSLTTPAGYPETPAEFLLSDIKGLSDRGTAELRAALVREAEGMAGEMMLGHLCETARGVLTEFNQPDGDCAFCLEPLRDQNAESAAQSADIPIQKLPCYHCYHSPCFAGWYAAEQRWKREQRQKLQDAKKHAVTGAMLDQLGLQTHEHALFTVLCPTCRRSPQAAALQEDEISAEERDERKLFSAILNRVRRLGIPVRPSEFGRKELAGLAEEAKRQQSSGHDDRVVRLPEKDMRFLRNQQRQNRAMFDRQLSKGGIVADHYAVAI